MGNHFAEIGLPAIYADADEDVRKLSDWDGSRPIFLYHPPDPYSRANMIAATLFKKVCSGEVPDNWCGNHFVRIDGLLGSNRWYDCNVPFVYTKMTGLAVLENFPGSNLKYRSDIVYSRCRERLPTIMTSTERLEKLDLPEIVIGFLKSGIVLDAQR